MLKYLGKGCYDINIFNIIYKVQQHCDKQKQKEEEKTIVTACIQLLNLGVGYVGIHSTFFSKLYVGKLSEHKVERIAYVLNVIKHTYE